MANTVRYHPDFDSDVVDAATWYSERKPDLGRDFVSRTYRAVNDLISDPDRRNNPEQYGIRYWPVDRFPYVIFFDVIETEILIVGVMHTSQDASKYRKRRE